ncbi:hypothetical protein GBA52_016930 [Prunus armeniaca]|nr:hypothetical protein GBA52_016930 [Prunus armeniaca]
MGCVCMKQRRQCDNADVLAAQTCFEITDIKTLYELFRKLSNSIVDDGLISKEEFQLGLFRNSKKQSLFADRIFYMFDSKHEGVIEFEEFIRCLSVFHPEAPQAEKAACKQSCTFLFEPAYMCKDYTKTLREYVKEMILALLKESDLILSDDIVEAIIDKVRHARWCYMDITSAFPSFVLRRDIEDETSNYL